MHYAVCSMHFALCTLHYALWNTRALAYDLENCRNFAAIPTPSELGDPSVWERDRPSFSPSHTYKESLCPISIFWGNQKDIFSNSLLLLFPHLQSPLLNRSYFLEHFLPPKDNFPHVSRSRVSQNPTFWSTTICWYLLISPFFGSTQNIYSQPPPLFLFPQYFPHFTKPSSLFPLIFWGEALEIQLPISTIRCTETNHIQIMKSAWVSKRDDKEAHFIVANLTAILSPGTSTQVEKAILQLQFNPLNIN